MTSSRSEHRRRGRSWERDERDHDRERDRFSRDYRGRDTASRTHFNEGYRRSSRSRSPRRGERDRRGGGGGGDRRLREDDRRDRERDRDRDHRDRRGGKGGRKVENEKRKEEKRDTDHTVDSPTRDEQRLRVRQLKDEEESQQNFVHSFTASVPAQPSNPSVTGPKVDLDPATPDESMDAIDDEDTAMMAVMGISGFASTKGKAVEGNQEGSAYIKKIRTWRQYMNRRGGFNRPLDKIK